MIDAADVLCRQVVEATAFWDESAHNAIPVFIGTPLEAAVWVRIVDLCAVIPLHLRAFGKLCAVVECDCFEYCGEVEESRE